MKAGPVTIYIAFHDCGYEGQTEVAAGFSLASVQKAAIEWWLEDRGEFYLETPDVEAVAASGWVERPWGVALQLPDGYDLVIRTLEAS